MPQLPGDVVVGDDHSALASGDIFDWVEVEDGHISPGPDRLVAVGDAEVTAGIPDHCQVVLVSDGQLLPDVRRVAGIVHRNQAGGVLGYCLAYRVGSMVRSWG